MYLREFGTADRKMGIATDLDLGCLAARDRCGKQGLGGWAFGRRVGQRLPRPAFAVARVLRRLNVKQDKSPWQSLPTWATRGIL